MSDSVKVNCRSDASLGCHLSGGLDSSVIVALMSGQLSSPVNTFTIGFGGDTDGFDDERKYARLVAERYRTKHREYEVSPDINEELVNRLVTSFGEPFATTG